MSSPTPGAVPAEEARRFLCRALGVVGDYLPPAGVLDRLGMVQVDTINIVGARNHELALAARSVEPVPPTGDDVERSGDWVETHFPVHRVRRDWAAPFVAGLGHRANRARAGLRNARRIEEKLLDYINAHGPVSTRMFESPRVLGGFNTLKATTVALHRLYWRNRIQIAGRTRNFERLFDLTERLFPELIDVRPLHLTPSEINVQVRYALAVLKLASLRSIGDRVMHHLGPWRADVGRTAVRADVRAALEAIGAMPVVVRELSGEEATYWHLAEDAGLWHTLSCQAPERITTVPPLDNLLFDRPRFGALFGHKFLFEAYKPIRQRRYYYAMPLIDCDGLAGIVDVKRENGSKLLIRRLDIARTVPIDLLRAALHRLARSVGAERVSCHQRLDRSLRQAISGSVARAPLMPVGNFDHCICRVNH
jgi:uncharacterized protein